MAASTPLQTQDPHEQNSRRALPEDSPPCHQPCSQGGRLPCNNVKLPRGSGVPDTPQACRPSAARRQSAARSAQCAACGSCAAPRASAPNHLHNHETRQSIIRDAERPTPARQLLLQRNTACSSCLALTARVTPRLYCRGNWEALVKLAVRCGAPARRFMSVVLPAPLGPTIATRLPMSCRATSAECVRAQHATHDLGRQTAWAGQCPDDVGILGAH